MLGVVPHGEVGAVGVDVDLAVGHLLVHVVVGCGGNEIVLGPQQRGGRADDGQAGGKILGGYVGEDGGPVLAVDVGEVAGVGPRLAGQAQHVLVEEFVLHGFG